MRAPHRYAAVATAVLLIAGVSLLPVVAGAQSKSAAPKAAAKCEESLGISILAAPLTPWSGAPLRVVVTAEQPLTGELSLVAPDGSVAAKSSDRHGGPPYFWYAEVAAPGAGKWQAKLVRDGAAGECGTILQEVAVQRKRPPGLRASSKNVWPVRDAWSRANENLYSAWIELLFDAPPDQTLSWPALHEVLRDRSRNVLFNHLGLGEDEKGQIVKPDCADLPYTLRAYFAFKMGLPFGYAKCTRGDKGKPPRCAQWWNIENEEPPPSPQQPAPAASGGQLFGLFGAAAQTPPATKVPQRPPGLVPGFGYYIRTTVANSVHSGNGRTMADDDNSDYYPVSLKQETLRPGTIYADPYGHLLVLVKRVSQTSDAAGVLLAVDGQPDGTIARKRFWRGNFLFAQDPALGGPGFKRFRPIMRGKGGLRRLANAEIEKNPGYGDFSRDQAALAIEDFYDRMDDVISPNPLDPDRAMREAVVALEEQVKARVTSVENGRKYQDGGGAEVAMPDGASIFETTGAWEDFATPSRDLRLLIAIDVVRHFPDRVARRPERYAMPPGKSAADVKDALERSLSSDLEARKFTYTRSDGSAWTLTLKDVVGRIGALEMAYNVNDCVELRWGAADGSDEAKTCKRRAPEAQRGKMTEYRAWFNERRRPPRG